MAIINSYPTVTPDNDDLLLIVDTSVEGNPTKTATVSSVASQVTLGYTSYVARWTQGTTNAPVVTELYNNTGLTWTATRSSAGVYRFTASANFGTKVYAIASDRSINSGGTSPASTGTNIVAVNEAGPTFVSIENRDSADKSLVDNVQTGMLEIRIYT
tara:strand:+ start:555 stop:1028 length:474 start_codon:yes stop_codon:yes gene_type:complete